MGSVTYDRKNGELRNDVGFFAQFATRPDDIRWTVAPGDPVRPGQELGRFVWPDQPSDCVIVAPLGCGGVVATINRGVVCRFLGKGPSQVLMEIRRPFVRAGKPPRKKKKRPTPPSCPPKEEAAQRARPHLRRTPAA